jgi:hypothetical protein
VADKCENEKKALDEAERNSATFEDWMNKLDKSAAEWEAEAQQELGSIGKCSEPVWSEPSEGGMRVGTEQDFEKCVIDKWIKAHELLKDALNARENADEYRPEWQRWEYEAHKREKKYCDCRNETPD